MIARLCLGVRGKPCGRIVAASERRCPDCLAAHNRARNAERTAGRGSREARGYDWHWRRLSTAYRKRNPVCELRYPGCAFRATEVDHVRPLRAGGRSVRSNLAAVCRPCHRLKTRADAERWPEYPEGVTP